MQNNSRRVSPLPSAAQAARGGRSATRARHSCPNGASPIFIPRPTRPRFARDLEGAGGSRTHQGSAISGKLAELDATGLALRRDRGIRARWSRLIGRLGSYAGLLYAADTSPIPNAPSSTATSQKKLTAISTDLIFFELELNQIDDAHLAQALQEPALARYKPWIDNLRKEKPYQLDEHARAAVPREERRLERRLGPPVQRDHDGAALRGRGRGEPLPLEPTLNLLSDPDERKRQAAAEALAERLQGQCPPLHADHQHAGQGQGDLRPLARLQGRRRQPPSCQPRRGPGRRRAGRGRARCLSAPVASLLRDEGEVARQGAARPLGPQRAAAR